MRPPDLHLWAALEPCTMSTTLVITRHVDAAHVLPHVPEGHPCGRMHGHRYQLDFAITGPINPDVGWVIDFAEVNAVLDPLLARLDHHLLNDVAGLGNPTVENFAAWLWQAVKPVLRGLCRVEVAENPHARCIYTGPDSP